MNASYSTPRPRSREAQDLGFFLDDSTEYGTASPPGSIASWQVDMADQLLKHQSHFSQASSTEYLSHDLDIEEDRGAKHVPTSPTDSSPFRSPVVSPTNSIGEEKRFKDRRRLVALNKVKEGLRRDKIIRIMNSRYQRRFDPAKWPKFHEFHRLLRRKEHRFRKPLRQIFGKRLLQPKESQRVSIDYLVSVAITHYYPNASISPKKARGGGAGKAPEIGRALFETYSLDADGDAQYKQNMNRAEKLIRRICECYDYDEDGTIDWRELLCALEVLRTPPIGKPELMHILQFWWEIFDSHNVGFMKWDPGWKQAITTASTNDWDYEFIQGLGARVFLMGAACTVEEGGWKTMNPSVEDIEKTHEHGLVYYEDMMRALNTHMGEKFLAELRRQCWGRNPESRRLEIILDRCDRQTELINQLEDRMFKQEIANIWLQVEPPKRFHKWVNALFIIDGRRLAKAWFNKKAKMRGLRSWMEYAPARRQRRRIHALVARHAGRLFEKRYIRLWKSWSDFQKEVYEASLLRATELYQERVWRNTFGLWHATTKLWKEEREEQLRAAIALWQGNSLEFCFHRWKENKDYQIAQKAAEYQQMQFMMSMMEGDQVAEIERMAHEEKIMREFMAADAKRIEEEEFAAMWDDQRHKTQQSLVARAQEKERLEYKAGVVKKKLDHDDSTWNTLAKAASVKAENEAREFINSKDGKKFLKQLVKEFRKKPEEDMFRELNEGTANIPGCLWQAFLEVDPRGVLNTKVFWFKESTMDRFYDDTLDSKITKDICLERFVAGKVHETLEKAEQMKAKQQEAYYDEVAAKKIQSAWRNLKTRRLVRRVAREQWEKVVDPDSGEIFYRNKKNGYSSWIKPHIFGSEDIGDPPIWCVRIDPRTGGYYYFNRVNEDMSSKKKPKGFILCCECQTMFADRRCMDKSCSGARFCDACCREYHKIPARESHEIVEVKIKIALCKVCQSSATQLCYGCIGETYCDRCSKLIHSAGEMAGHTSYERVT